MYLYTNRYTTTYICISKTHTRRKGKIKAYYIIIFIIWYVSILYFFTFLYAPGEFLVWIFFFFLGFFVLRIFCSVVGLPLLCLISLIREDFSFVSIYEYVCVLVFFILFFSFSQIFNEFLSVTFATFIVCLASAIAPKSMIL